MTVVFRYIFVGLQPSRCFVAADACIAATLEDPVTCPSCLAHIIVQTRTDIRDGAAGVAALLEAKGVIAVILALLGFYFASNKGSDTSYVTPKTMLASKDYNAIDDYSISKNYNAINVKNVSIDYDATDDYIA